MAGDTLVAPGVTRRPVAALRCPRDRPTASGSGSRPDSPTREVEVLHPLADGMSNAEITARVTETVKTYVKNMATVSSAPTR